MAARYEGLADELLSDRIEEALTDFGFRVQILRRLSWLL
jgi:hypothetical protein